MTAPRLFPFRFQRSSQSSPLVSLGVGEVAAVEVGARSEVDRFRLIDARGQDLVVAVGAPAIGLLEGPIKVLPYGAFPPIATGSSAYETPLRAELPVCELLVHECPPPAFAAKRAPANRKFYSAGIEDAYVVVAEVPVYGRALVTINLHGDASEQTNMTFRLRGRLYRPDDDIARTPATFEDHLSATDSTADGFLMPLDAAGATTDTFNGGSDSTEWVDTAVTVHTEGLHTVAVEVLGVIGVPTNVHVTTEARD